VVGLTVRTTLATTEEPFSLVIEGRAMVDKKEIVRQAVPAEDRMQAFLWRHLVSAEKLQSLVFNPSYQPPPKCVPPTLAERKTETGDGTGATTVAGAPATPRPKFTQQQVASRLRDLNRLYAAGYLTDEFFLEKVAECQVTQ
jgi:hypothetical protein